MIRDIITGESNSLWPGYHATTSSRSQQSIFFHPKPLLLRPSFSKAYIDRISQYRVAGENLGLGGLYHLCWRGYGAFLLLFHVDPAPRRGYTPPPLPHSSATNSRRFILSSAILPLRLLLGDITPFTCRGAPVYRNSQGRWSDWPRTGLHTSGLMLSIPLLRANVRSVVALIYLEKEIVPVILCWLTFWVFGHMYALNKITSGSLFLALCYSLLSICLIFFLVEKSLTFYVLFEMSLLPTLLIVLFFGYQPEKLQARLYLLLYTVLASLPLLLVILSLSPYLRRLSLGSASFLILCLTLGFIVKTPMYLVHVWLPKAHVEAPVAGRIVLAGILLKLGSFGLLLFCPLLSGGPLLLYLFLSLLGRVVCGAICTRQWDSKSLIAYSSVVHIGVVTVGVVLGSELGYFCAVLIVIAHGICSPLIFAVAYLLYSNTHTRLLSSNRGHLGIPLYRLILFLLLAINMGVPPFINLWREVFMFLVLIGGFTHALWVLVPVAFVGVLYNLFIYVRLGHGKERQQRGDLAFVWPFLRSTSLSLLGRACLVVWSVCVF